ncbi:MAG: pitrilysin family protein [Humidesulfovibrio sp.]|uniref:M16 family metallopeptidase n=1 Tax=Humidesulfovibrio sp. TaxID=2910988 RepID=UPI002734BC8C|nr:pitrilysin family protein [Humidesulfovibrio sp.]MDP2847879.1 pitrilysin family protein [Humidesulfovibrio sp.]
MRRTLSWFLAALLVLTAASAQAAKKYPAAKAKRPAPAAPALAPVLNPALMAGAPSNHIDGVTFLRLKNGLSVLVKEDDRFPLAHIRMLVHAGSAYETPAQAGISHVLEHMVFKGAGSMKPGEVARRIEAAGGSLNASTSFDNTAYHVEVPDSAWKLGLSVVADMTFKPTLAPAELESEKDVVLAELKRGEDTPENLLFQTLQAMLWKGTSYEWPIIGFRETVRATTSQSMRAYIAPLYQPQNMVLCVVGKVKATEVLAEAERLLGGIQNTSRITPPQPFPIQAATGPQLTIVPGMWNKVHLGLALPAPDFLSSKMGGLDMLAQILGGDETSRLYRKFKYELRLVDSVSVGVSNLERSGILVIGAVLDADKLPAFWDALTSELASFDALSITDQELLRARTNIEAGLFLTRETISGLASKLTHQYAFEGGQQGEANYLATIAAAGRPQLASLYREFFRPEAVRAVILAPKGVTIAEAPLLDTLKRRWPASKAKTAAKADASASAVRQISLPGGGTLVLQPDATLPYTALSMAWPGGDGLLSANEQGLGALTASLLARGTKTRSANQVEDFLADRAASFAASTSSETFSLGAKFPSRFTTDMLGLVRETLASPALAEAELARAKEDQQNAIKRGEDQPIGLAFRKLPGLLFTSAPHAYLRLGDPAQVAGFTRSQAEAFWKRQAAQPFVLSVCGQFDEAQMTAFATALARELNPQGATPAQAQAPQWKPKAKATLHLPERNQSHLFVIFKAPGRADQAMSARLQVLRAALAGQSGLLFRDMRDKQGLGYTVTAFLSQYKEAGFMAFYIGSDPDKLPQAMEGFRKAAADLAAKPLPQAELTRAKNILSGDYYQDRQSLMSRSREAAGALVQGFEREAELKLVEASQALTAEDVRQAAAAVLKWDEAFVLEVTP